MKKLFTLVCLLAAAGWTFAQNYTTASSTGTEAAFDYAATGSSIMAGANPATDQLSAAQTIPFTFTFYGQAVTQYKVSDNGYITFNTGATTSDPNNGTLPNALSPTNAIFAFWDALDVSSAGNGSADAVKSWTYGTTPTRIHVIEWYSVTPTGATPSTQVFLYATIRLYECGDFDVVLPFGGTVTTSATIGAQDATGANAVTASGPSAAFPTGLTGPGSDDVVHNFFWGGVNYDVAVTTMNLNDYVTVGSNNLQIGVKNFGSTTITSLDLNYTVNGGSNQSSNITGISIAPGASTTINHPVPLSISTGGSNYQLCVWADNLNSGNPDGRSCNDELCRDLFGINGNSGDKHVLIEEFTGAWCGWCPHGAEYLEAIESGSSGPDVEIASAHLGPAVGGNDAMENQPSKDLRTNFNVSSYPSAMVDRVLYSGEAKEPHSRSYWQSNTTAQLAEFTPCDLTVTNTYSQSTRQVEANVTVDFTDYAIGDIRVFLYVTEDHVSGSGAGYDQVNYLYQNASYSSSVYYNAGDPIINYDHRHVLREAFPSVTGNSGLIPATANPLDSYTYSTSFTLSANYDENEVRLVGVVAYYSTSMGEREVINTAGTTLNIVGVDPSEERVGIEVYPNPASDIAIVNLGFDAASDAEISLTNQYGQVVATLGNSSFHAGSSKVSFDVKDLANGVYFVNVKTSNGSFAEKIVVSR